MSAPILLFGVLGGLLQGIFYASMALGLNLIFGVTKVINAAHGNLVVLGAFFAFFMVKVLPLPPVLTLVLAFPVFFMLGVGIYFVFVPRLLKGTNFEINSFVAFFGLAIIIESLSFVFFGASFKALPTVGFLAPHFSVFGYGIPAAEVFAGGVSVVIVALTYLYLNKTRLGMATRALIKNQQQAMNFGVNPFRLSILLFGFAIALTGIAGVLSPYIFGYIYPSLGDDITLISFVVVIIGALGNPLSTVVGGLIYGVVINVLDVYLTGLSDAITFVVLIVVIVLKPGGLLGGVEREI